MTHNLIDREDKQSKRNIVKLIVSTLFCSLFLVCIAFSHSIFHIEPSLGYLALIYVAAIMAILSLALINLVSSKRKLWVGIITLGSTIALFFAAVNNAPNEALMKTGQVTTAVSFVMSLGIYIFIWKK